MEAQYHGLNDRIEVLIQRHAAEIDGFFMPYSLSLAHVTNINFFKKTDLHEEQGASENALTARLEMQVKNAEQHAAVLLKQLDTARQCSSDESDRLHEELHRKTVEYQQLKSTVCVLM